MVNSRIIKWSVKLEEQVVLRIMPSTKHSGTGNDDISHLYLRTCMYSYILFDTLHQLSGKCYIFYRNLSNWRFFIWPRPLYPNKKLIYFINNHSIALRDRKIHHREREKEIKKEEEKKNVTRTKTAVGLPMLCRIYGFLCFESCICSYARCLTLEYSLPCVLLHVPRAIRVNNFYFSFTIQVSI